MLSRVMQRACLVAATQLFVIGCGGGGTAKTAVVSGKVTLAGKGPLPGGNITFTPSASPDKARTTAIKSDGTYSVPDVARGECKVTIETSSLRSLPQAPKGTELPGMGGTEAAKYVPIDAKYSTAGGSGLSTNVDGSTVTYDVELK